MHSLLVMQKTEPSNRQFFQLLGRWHYGWINTDRISYLSCLIIPNKEITSQVSLRYSFTCNWRIIFIIKLPYIIASAAGMELSSTYAWMKGDFCMQFHLIHSVSDKAEWTLVNYFLKRILGLSQGIQFQGPWSEFSPGYAVVPIWGGGGGGVGTAAYNRKGCCGQMKHWKWYRITGNISKTLTPISIRLHGAGVFWLLPSFASVLFVMFLISSALLSSLLYRSPCGENAGT